MCRGRLGISQLDDLNVALIVKWRYRFFNERDNLWRRVVCAKSGVDLSRMLHIINRSSKKSSLFNLIWSLLDKNDRVSFLVQQGFRSLIRN